MVDNLLLSLQKSSKILVSVIPEVHQEAVDLLFPLWGLVFHSCFQ